MKRSPRDLTLNFMYILDIYKLLVDKILLRYMFFLNEQGLPDTIENLSIFLYRMCPYRDYKSCYS